MPGSNFKFRAALLGLVSCLSLAAAASAQIDALPEDVGQSLGSLDVSAQIAPQIAPIEFSELNAGGLLTASNLFTEPREAELIAASISRFKPEPPAADEPTLQIGDSSIKVLVDGDQFVSESLKIIASAHQSLDLEMFDFQNEQLVNALTARAKEIPVRVVLDPFPGYLPRKIALKIRLIRRLRRAGAQVVFYPVRDLHGAIFRIDHAKLLIADGKSAVAGGTNWMSRPGQNHDYNLVLSGQAVRALNEIFANAWAVSNGLAAPPRAPAAMDPGNGVETLLTDFDHEETLEALLYHIALAKRIRAEEYLINEPRVVDALIAAKRRGADIEILLDGARLGVNAETAQRLMREGIAVRFFHDPQGAQVRLHAKAAVFDDELVILGSTNWSLHALNVNHEISLMFRSRDAAQELDEAFQADWEGRSLYPGRARGLKKLLILVASAVGRLIA